MSGSLPFPNIEPPPGAQLDSAAVAAIFAEIQRNFDALSGKFPVSGGDLMATYIKAKNGKGFAATGVVTLTWAAATSSAIALVKHGLGVTPTFVGFTPIAASTTPISTRLSGAPSETEFGCMSVLGASFTGSISHQWVALG